MESNYELIRQLGKFQNQVMELQEECSRLKDRLEDYELLKDLLKRLIEVKS